jgi:hypothetical protein
MAMETGFKTLVILAAMSWFKFTAIQPFIRMIAVFGESDSTVRNKAKASISRGVFEPNGGITTFVLEITQIFTVTHVDKK